ncbi:MAG: hypothetical protein LBH41_02190 [Rickettsiales bacterium]|jgi:hypothetical protein|nr:hypothetical protein [Rickettsiales bacterium]
MKSCHNMNICVYNKCSKERREACRASDEICDFAARAYGYASAAAIAEPGAEYDRNSARAHQRWCLGLGFDFGR